MGEEIPPWILRSLENLSAVSASVSNAEMLAERPGEGGDVQEVLLCGTASLRGGWGYSESRCLRMFHLVVLFRRLEN